MGWGVEEGGEGEAEGEAEAEKKKKKIARMVNPITVNEFRSVVRGRGVGWNKQGTIHLDMNTQKNNFKVGQRFQGISTAMKYSFKQILLETLFLQLDSH